MNIRIAKKIMKVCNLHYSYGYGRFYSYSEYQREKAAQKYYKKEKKRIFIKKEITGELLDNLNIRQYLDVPSINFKKY